MRIIEAKPIKQDHEAAESGENVKKGCNSGCAEDRESGISLADTTLLRTKRRRYMREILFYSLFALEGVAFYRNNYVFWY